MKWHFSASLLTLWLSSQGRTREEQNIFPLSPLPAAHVKGMKGRCTNTGGLCKFLLGMQETVCIVNIQWLCEIQKNPPNLVNKVRDITLFQEARK